MTRRLLTICLVLWLSVGFSVSRMVGQDQGGVPKEGVLTDGMESRLPVPNGADLKAAQKQVREVFESDFKLTKSVEAKWQLAQKLNREATENKADTNTQYALFTEAMGLYLEVGDVLSGFRTVDEIAEIFAIKPIAKKLELLKQQSKAAKLPLAKRLLALVGLKLAGDSAAIEDYPAAKECCTIAVAQARGSRDAIVLKRATEQQKRYDELLKVWQQADAAQKILKAKPDDPEANLVVGKYRCLTRQDWEGGLPLLKLGNDLELKGLAEKDLAANEQVSQQEAVGAAWWNYAESLKGGERSQYMARVAFWYEKALPGIDGLVKKAAAEKRLDAAYQALSGRDFKKILSNVPNGIQSQGVVDCSANAVSAEMQKGFDVRRSWVLSLEFNPPDFPPGPHVIFGWADGRAGQDPLVLGYHSTNLQACVDDCAGNRRQVLVTSIDPKMAGKWVDVKFVYDSLSQEFELYINKRLVKKEQAAIAPNIDQQMPVSLGAVTGNEQRFFGQIRNVWLGNTP